MNEHQVITPEALLEHQDFVRSLARSLLFDENQVDDVVQQAWVVALRKGPGHPGALRSWLAAVTRNLSRNHRRGEGRRQKHEKRVPPRELAPSASEIVQREEIRGQVVEAVLALAEPYRSTLVLRYLEELSPKEIAARTGDPASTVRVRIKRGLAQLRQRLDEDMGGDRQAWMLALVPFAAAGSGAALALGVTGFGSLGKWAGAAALVLAMLGGWWIWEGSRVVADGEVVDVLEGENETAILANTVGTVTTQEDVVEKALDRRIQESPGEELPRAAMAGFKGRLVGPDGKPIVGGLVRILSGDLNRKLYARLSAFGKRERAQIDSKETRTDAGGRFTVHGLWPESFHVLAAGRGKQISLRKVLDRLPSAGQVMDLGDVLLPLDPTLSGRVLLPDGKPAISAWVWAGEFPGPGLALGRVPYFDPEAWIFDLQDEKQARALSLDFLPKGLLEALPLAWTKTDSTGAFSLSLPAGRSFALVARATGVEPYLRNRVRVRADKDKDLGEIHLKSGESLEGQVVDDQGDAVSGVQVLVAPLPGLRQIPLAFAGPLSGTNAEGHFQVSGLPRGGKVLAAVRRGPGEPWIFSKPVRAGDRLRFELPARFDLPLLIVDARGEAIRDPRIRVFPGEAHAEEILLGTSGAVIEENHLVAGSGDGRWTLRDLPRGPMTLLVGAKGRVTRRVLFGGSKEDLPLRITLSPATAVEVSVYSAAGKLVSGATLLSRRVDAAEWTRPNFDLFQGLQSEVLPIREGRTQKSGKLRIEDLPTGKVWITARHPLHGQISKLIHLPSSHETLVFAKSCIVDGRVVSTEKQLAEHPSMIHLWKIGGNDTRAMPNQPHLMVPDREGRFRFTGVEPGRYLIQVHPALSAARTLKDLVTHFTGLSWSNLATQRFTLAAGDYKSVVMKWPHRPKVPKIPGTCAIEGVFRVDGSADDNVELLVFEANGPLDQDRFRLRDGRFSIAGLHPGKVFLSFYGKGGASNENLLLKHSVLLKDSQKVLLDLSVHLGNLDGVVMSAEGAPVGGAEIVVYQLEPREKGAMGRTGLTRRLLCDSSGRFRVKGLPSGEYELQGSCKLGYGWARTRIEARPSAPIQVRIRRGHTVTGFFDPADWNWKWAKDHSYSVILAHSENALEISGEVGKDGTFRIPLVPEGRYRIKAGHRIQIRTISMSFSDYGGYVDIPAQDLSGLRVRPPKR